MIQVNDFIGIPFKNGGREPDGVDCYGLVRLILKERQSVDLPSLRYDDSFDCRAVSAELDSLFNRFGGEVYFEKVDKPSGGEVVILQHKGFPGHCGLMLDELRFVHSLPGVGSVVSRLDDPVWKGKEEGFYRACSA